MVSFLVRLELEPWLSGDRGFTLFVPAIILTTALAGSGPGVLTALLSGIATWYYFLPPIRSFSLDTEGLVGLGTFVLGASISIALTQWSRLSTKRLERERARTDALARQRQQLIEAAPNGMLVVDSKGLIRVVNARLEKQFGYRREELLGRSVEMLVPPRFRSGHAALRGGFAARPSTRPMGAGRDLHGLRKDGSEFPVEIGLASFAIGNENMSLAIVIDITERKHSAEREALLVRELQHRTKNLLAVVQALALRSLRGDCTLDEARETFVGRLGALARADQRLTDSAWKGTSLKEVVASELRPFAGRFKIEAADVVLSPQAAQNFALALHELATNASKHGALSRARSPSAGK